MLTMTDKRPKVTFDVPERVRRALAIFAAERNCTIGEAIEGLVTEHLPDHLSQADRAMATGQAGPVPKRGRRPKGD